MPSSSGGLMQNAMRAIQRRRAARAASALLVSALVSLAAWRAGPVVMLALLFTSLLVVTFSALTIAPDLVAFWRGHQWRWWWRSSDDEGPFWLGTRVPRHPRRPLLPSRGAAAMPPETPLDS
jgi:hypothetical protein